MNISKLLADTGMQTAIFSLLVTFFFGILTAILIQIWQDRRQRISITFSRKTETPLTIAKEELKEKFDITYEGTKIDKLYFFNLKIANTGKKMVTDQNFTCQFANHTTSIDPIFPRIRTFSPTPTLVGPIVLTDSTDTKYNYNIEKLNLNQTIEIDFLTINNSNDSFIVEFDPKDGIVYSEGEIAKIPTLEAQVRSLVIYLLVSFTLLQTANLLPYPFSIASALLSIPSALIALKNLRPIITYLTAIKHEPTFSTIINGMTQGLVVGSYGDMSMHYRQPTEATTDSQINPPK